MSLNKETKPKQLELNNSKVENKMEIFITLTKYKTRQLSEEVTLLQMVGYLVSILPYCRMTH